MRKIKYFYLDARRFANAGEGPAELKRHQQEAEQQGVFAVPTFVVDGELFRGQDRIDFVRAKLAA
jgi:2-hydroxychromene-2-carboxylate isomerase